MIKSLKIKGRIQGKKAVLKIIEAFIAIMIILGVVLVLIAREKIEVNRAEEIMRLQRNILDYAANDESLRAGILVGDKAGVGEAVGKLVPSWINYSVNICSSSEVCPNPIGYIDREVYSNEVLIAANLTYYQAGNVTKLKLFFWEK